MKSKYLKTYENYKLGYLNDDFFNDFEKEFENEDNMEFVEEDEVEKDKESDEDVEETDTEEVEGGEEVADEAEVEGEDGKIAVSVSVAEYEVGGEKPEPAICDPMMPDMPISTGFNPSDNFNTMPKAEWCIIKCMTNNGERIGIDQNGTDCEVLCSGLHYDDAVSKVEEFARRTTTPAFDNDSDVYLGKVSKHFIKKPNKPSGGFDGSGSYKTSM